MREKKFKSIWLITVIMFALVFGFIYPSMIVAASYENPGHGIYADKVKIGASLPLSGTLASMGKSIVEGLEVYLSMVNEKGGINGRQIESTMYDDEYKPDKSVANSKLLVERDKVFAVVAAMGTGTYLAAYE